MRLPTVSEWTRWKPLVLELFVTVNLAFLALDIYVAHSVNRFAEPAEWIPFYFSIVAAAAMGTTLASSRGRLNRAAPRWCGFVVGGAAIAVGVTGLWLHLESQFFDLWTLGSLVYTAPFVAPLAYAGLGFLLLMNRLVKAASSEWDHWVLFFCLGGFVGNFILSVCDHAQNGFFHATEWIPVVASGLACGFLAVALFEPSPRFQRACLAVLALQGLVGALGFALHLAADVNGVSASLYENFVHGAPIFAPLLFANLFLLGAIGCLGAVGTVSEPG